MQLPMAARFIIICISFSQNFEIKGTQCSRSIVVIQVKNFLNELMVEIFSKSLVRAIGKVLRMKIS